MPRRGAHGGSSDIVAFDFYRSRLPHVRIQGATYFVTWRLQKAQAELSEVERALVAESLRHFDGRRYLLHAYVVMNDHVHVLVEPRAAFRLESIVQSWKSFSAKRIGTLRGLAGTIWQREYFDRVIRDEDEYRQKRDYILENPFRRWPTLHAYSWQWAIGLEPQ